MVIRDICATYIDRVPYVSYVQLNKVKRLNTSNMVSFLTQKVNKRLSLIVLNAKNLTLAKQKH